MTDKAKRARRAERAAARTEQKSRGFTIAFAMAFYLAVLIAPLLAMFASLRLGITHLSHDTAVTEEVVLFVASLAWMWVGMRITMILIYSSPRLDMKLLKILMVAPHLDSPKYRRRDHK